MRGGSGLGHGSTSAALRPSPLAVSARSGDDPAWLVLGTKEIVAQRAADLLLPTIQSGGCRLCLR